MRSYDSLREKLIQPFVLLGFVVSATLSLATFALLAHIEESAVVRTLHAELESFRYRLAANPDAVPANAALLRGYFLPVPEVPANLPATMDDGGIVIRMIGDVDYSVLRANVEGRPFALLYDRSYIKSNLEQLALLLLLATGALTGLSFLVAHGLARRVVRPVVRLLHDVAGKAEAPGFPVEPIAFSAEDYPQDEIGRLVREIDRFSLRLYQFLQRESYFAADVSHELRTPISVILGATEVLCELPGLSEPVRSRVQVIHRQARRMGQILEAMLLLGREEGGDGDPACAIGEVIEEALGECLPSLQGRPIELRASFLSHPILPAERSLAYVVIGNLLRNACAHTREGVIEVRLYDDRLEVEDTGVGMPGERFEKLLERHARGEDSVGYGLGLSIVARICQRLGWSFSVDTAPGRGTCARMQFPPASDKSRTHFGGSKVLGR